jgi:hypothetical protein
MLAPFLAHYAEAIPFRAQVHCSVSTAFCRLQVFVLDRLIEDDGIRGDEYGEFDKAVVTEERARLKREKVTPVVLLLPQESSPNHPNCG